MLVLWWLGAAAMLHAQQPNVHYWHHGVMPPGAIGSRQLQRGGPLPGFFQPVEIKAPPGARAFAGGRSASSTNRGPARGRPACLIGAVYRLRVTNIRLAEGAEVFPTIEVIDRLYAPAGQELPLRHPDRHHRGRPEAGAGRQVRHAGDLPRRPRQALPARRDDSRRTGSTPRRARTRWPWPTDWDARWRSCVSAEGCRTKAPIPFSSSDRRRLWLFPRSKPPRRRKPRRRLNGGCSRRPQLERPSICHKTLFGRRLNCHPNPRPLMARLMAWQFNCHANAPPQLNAPLGWQLNCHPSFRPRLNGRPSTSRCRRIARTRPPRA